MHKVDDSGPYSVINIARNIEKSKYPLYKKVLASPGIENLIDNVITEEV